MANLIQIVRTLFIALTVLAALGVPGAAFAATCEQPDVGGTSTFPPLGCDYTSPDGLFVISDGLPPGTTIELEPVHKDYICGPGVGGFCTTGVPPGICEIPGGSLGGTASCFDSTIEFQVKGTGALAGFNRFIILQTFDEAHLGPRTPGNATQPTYTDLFQLQGDLFGDPDFDTLSIRAGTLFGLPSPGMTTLTTKSNGAWRVESFFDVAYQIDFVGAPGSILEGLSGSTTSSVVLEAGTNPCRVADNGTGTVDLPPAGCEYVSKDEVHQIINGLPPGTTIDIELTYRNYVCGFPFGTCTAALPPGVCEGAGGSLGGNISCAQTEAHMKIWGTGALAGFNRTIVMPLDTEFHHGPRNPGDPVQSFPSTVFRLQGQIFGDPDFCVFRLRGGDQNGLPGPGHTTLFDEGDGTFSVDSFFDVSYEFDFQGCPGSILEGFGTTSGGVVRMETGDPVEETIPSLTGAWLWLFAVLLTISSLWVIARRQRQD